MALRSERVDIVERARDFAADAYSAAGDREHPSEVCELVTGAGAAPEIQAAALLHDLIEDTDTTVGEIEGEFGGSVAGLVAALTEDESIDDYVERKAEARARARDAGADAALIFVADKLSNARRMRRAQKKPDAKKVAHYAATLELMRDAYRDLPLLDELDAELHAIRDELQRLPA